MPNPTPPANDPSPLDHPNSISVAEFEAHLRAHQALEEKIAAQNSIPVTIQGPGGWSVKSRGTYLIAFAALTLAGLFGWLLAGK